MTQFGRADFEGYPQQEAPYAPPVLKPWSAAAIAAFVLSLAGCLGITAILGLIFGVVGIVKTQRGKRRGRGFAIAALPIALVTGALSVMVAFSFLFIGRVATQLEGLQAAIVTHPQNAAQAVAMLRAVCTDDFNAAVSDTQLTTWIEQIHAKHGTMTGLNIEETKSMRPVGGKRRRIAVLSIPARFVNGTATLEASFAFSGLTQVQIDDIAIDASSPRSIEERSPQPLKPAAQP